METAENVFTHCICIFPIGTRTGSEFDNLSRTDRLFKYRVEQEECARLREDVPYVRVYRYNPKHLYPKLNGLGDNGQ